MPPEKPAIEKLTELVTLAATDYSRALAEIRRLFDASPRLWQSLGDLGKHAELALIDLAAGQNPATKESLIRKLDELKSKLAGPSPSPLDQLLVDRIAACWLQVSHADLLAARTTDPKQLDHLGKRQEQANRRFLQAVKTLATVRKLLRPTPAPVEIASRFDNMRVVSPRPSTRELVGVDN